MKMTCEQTAPELAGLLYDEIDAEIRPAVEEHVAGCVRCADELRTLRAASAVLREAPLPKAPPGFTVAVPRRRVFPRSASLIAASVLAAILLYLTSFDSGLQASGEIRVEKVEVSATVYNQDLALIRDRRNILNLKAGRNTVRFTDVPALIDPTSVNFFSITDPAGTKVLEQNFEFDLVSSDKLLHKFVDGQIQCLFKDGSVGKGTLLSYDAQSLLLSQASGEVSTYSRQNLQSILLPKLPEGLLSRPTLVWELEVKTEGKHETMVTYLTGGMSWRADYTLIDRKGDRLELAGWVTVGNDSGTTYDNAGLKLIAGDVHRVKETLRRELAEKKLEDASGAQDKANAFEEKSFFEYHLYTLGRSTSLRASEVKQIEFLKADGITGRRIYEYDANQSIDRVGVKLEFKNSKENKLGMPLPQGTLRLSAEVGPETEFVRAVGIQHTPKDEKVTVFAGHAFDLTAERAVTRHERDSNGRTRKQVFELKLRNHKDEDVTIDVVEGMAGPNWSVASARPYEKLDAYRIRFTVAVPKNSEQVVGWTVDYEW